MILSFVNFIIFHTLSSSCYHCIINRLGISILFYFIYKTVVDIHSYAMGQFFGAVL
jgi:hypothetical protein